MNKEQFKAAKKYLLAKLSIVASTSGIRKLREGEYYFKEGPQKQVVGSCIHSVNPDPSFLNRLYPIGRCRLVLSKEPILPNINRHWMVGCT